MKGMVGANGRLPLRKPLCGVRCHHMTLLLVYYLIHSESVNFLSGTLRSLCL